MNVSMNSLGSANALSWARSSATGNTSRAGNASTPFDTDRPPAPPGPPPSGSSGSDTFTMSMSTRQFATLGSESPPAPKDFASMDADGDGSVSADEYGLDQADERDARLFSSIDQDSDGSLSRAEVDDFESMMSQGGPGGPGGPGGAPGGPGPDPLTSLDSDDDGAVSASEFGLDQASDAVQALFAAVDTDDDGSLSADEMDSMRQQMQDGPSTSSGTDAMLERLARDYLSTLGSSSSSFSVSA